MQFGDPTLLPSTPRPSADWAGRPHRPVASLHPPSFPEGTPTKPPHRAWGQHPTSSDKLTPQCPRGLCGAHEGQATCAGHGSQRRGLERLLPSSSDASASGHRWVLRSPRTSPTGAGAGCLVWLVGVATPQSLPRPQHVASRSLREGVTRATLQISHPNQQIRIRAKVKMTSEKGYKNKKNSLLSVKNRICFFKKRQSQ